MNAVGWTKGFEADSNTVLVIGDDGAVVARAEGTKRAVSDAVWDAIVAHRAAR